MSKYILTHDLGTSGNKATLYNFEGRLEAFHIDSYSTYYPAPNSVEQNPAQWWDSICKSTKAILKDNNIASKDIACISFSGQMMGCVLVDQKGEILRNAIIWADSRGSKQEAFIKEQIDPFKLYRITGHRPTAFYSLAKLLWVKDNEPETYQKVYKMLNAKDYIVYRLTGEFVTDYSDAGGTNLFDLENKRWSQDIIDAVGISSEILPHLCTSLDSIGTGISKEAAEATGLLTCTPVIIGGGDGSCATVGAGAVREGEAYIVVGSSSWIAKVSLKPVYDPDMKVFNWTTLDPNFYTPNGTMQTAGYSVSWLKDTLCKDDSYDDINAQISLSPPGANGVLFLPYLLGERSPRWNSNARAGFLGMTMTSSKSDMMRSVLEGVGYNLKIILDIIDNPNENPSEKITAIGGGAKSEIWLQILADIWQKPIVVPEYLEEATSMGAAICAGTSIGVFKGFDTIYSCNRPVKTIAPNRENAATYQQMYNLFDRVYNALEGQFNTWTE